MEVKELNPEGQGPSQGTGLGGRLVAAREAQGLTLANVAKHLRLPAATLQALESNRYEDLPEPIYVRGYLRAYARLLVMDEEALVAEYGRQADTPEPVLKPTSKVPRQAITRDPYIFGAATLIVVMVLGVWWYSRLKHDVPADSQTASSESEQPASLASLLPPPQIDSPNEGSGPVVALPPDIPPQSLASEAAEESVDAVEPEPLKETVAAEEPAMALVSESHVTANANAVVQHQDVDVTVEPTIPDLPIAPLASEHRQLVRASRAPTGGDVLIIKANDESWAEVVDTNGYQLLYYLLHPGTAHRLQGQSPFRVFLGNAPAVDLNLNQERFDHTPFHRPNNTALFSVDDAS